MRSHLALVVVTVLAGTACTRNMQAAQHHPCAAPHTTRATNANGIGIIGMSLDQHTGAAGTPELFVDRVVPEGPAASAGLRPGDRILAIEGSSTAGMTIAEAARRLRGPTDASVTLQVTSGDRNRDVIIIRVAPSELWSRGTVAHPGGGGTERVQASDVAPATQVAVPPCRQ
jgi:C-terminal processing protease CtpA/Prc